MVSINWWNSLMSRSHEVSTDEMSPQLLQVGQQESEEAEIVSTYATLSKMRA